jgi:hypothetical protein
MRKIACSILGATLLALSGPALAQEGGQEAGQDAGEGMTFEDLVYLTCEEAWEWSGEDVDTTVRMIEVLAQFSLEKRGLQVVEDDPDLDEQFGTMIRGGCELDPDALLFAIVDRAIRRLAGQ